MKLFVRRQEDCQAVGKGMRDFMASRGNGGNWAATIIAEASFIHDDLLVEVELDAIVL